MILILRKEKYILGRIDLYFWVSGEKLVYFLGFGEQRQNTFREPRQLFSGIWGDQCIIFRDQGSTDSPWGPQYYYYLSCFFALCVLSKFKIAVSNLLNVLITRNQTSQQALSDRSTYRLFKLIILCHFHNKKRFDLVTMHTDSQIVATFLACMNMDEFRIGVLLLQANRVTKCESYLSQSH